MAKKVETKKVTEAKASAEDIREDELSAVTGLAPEEPKEEPVRKVGQKKVIDVNRGPQVVKPKVGDASEAVKLFQSAYALPKGTDTAYVTEDGNVFYQSSESSARAHANQSKQKLYIIKP